MGSQGLEPELGRRNPGSQSPVRQAGQVREKRDPLSRSLSVSLSRSVSQCKLNLSMRESVLVCVCCCVCVRVPLSHPAATPWAPIPPAPLSRETDDNTEAWGAPSKAPPCPAPPVVLPWRLQQHRATPHNLAAPALPGPRIMPTVRPHPMASRCSQGDAQPRPQFIGWG